MDSEDHGSSATSSRQAWPQAAAVARGARAWLREVMIMRELGLIAPAAQHTMHSHHPLRREWEEHPRTWCFAGAPVEASCAAANITTPRSFWSRFFMRHGAVAAYAGLVWVTTSSSSHGPRAARGCDQFLRSEWAIRHFYRYTAQSTFKCTWQPNLRTRMYRSYIDGTCGITMMHL